MLKYCFFTLFFLFSATFQVFSQSKQKKILTHKVYDQWKTIDEKIISADGNWLAYTLNLPVGDSEVEIFQTLNKNKTRLARAKEILFTPNSKFLIFKISPFADSIKKSKNKLSDSLAIYNLQTQKISKIAKVQSFKIAKESGNYLAYLHETDSIAKKKNTGAKLVLKNLENSEEKSFENVSEYIFDKKATKLGFIVKKDSLLKVGIYVYDLLKNTLKTIKQQKGEYKNLVFDDLGEQLAFIADLENPKPLNYKVFYAKKDTASVIADTTAFNFPDNWLISEHGKIYFSKNGEKLYFGTAPKLPKSIKKTDETVALEIWHWQDKRLQAQQNVELEQDKKKNYLAVISITDRKMIQIANLQVPKVQIATEGNTEIALGTSNLPYQQNISWETIVGVGQDLYAMNLKYNFYTPIAKKVVGNPEISPSGKFVIWYSKPDSAWFSYVFEKQKIVNLTKKIPFFDQAHDSPDFPESYPFGTWIENDEAFFVHDRYDLWQIDPNGEKNPIRLTEGKEKKMIFRYLAFDSEEKFVQKNDILLLQTIQEESRAEGFANLSLKSKKVQTLYADDSKMTFLAKAKDANQIIFSRQSYQLFPDIYTSDLEFKKTDQASFANPQQADFLWGSVETVSWTSLDGKKLKGLLYKPENFDPNKKYPMITYFYETFFHNLHLHRPPTPSESNLRFSMYNSNGYFLFVPDIVYEIGYPGQSAYNCVVSGVVNLLENRPYIDSKKLGIQGQSWGAYQALYIITRSNLFAAAVATAAVSNMTSAYGGIRWGTGLSRQFQYEKTQSRIGGTLWQKPLLYLENSPLFQADKVQTPLLMMNNDEDDAVPFEQGIEFFLALRRLEKPVWMLSYKGEKHNLQKRHNKKDYSVRLQEYWDFMLKNSEAPTWLKIGQPALERMIEEGKE
ncbi:MAG: S9 family peptidase [Bacteroidetes bacterium]|nr:MAG: S9 family peptidase [Bacteroidota bacterium]